MKDEIFNKIINNENLKRYEYYRTELGVLYNGDCLELMKHIDDNVIDMVLTDPPYGRNYKTNFNNYKGKNKN